MKAVLILAGLALTCAGCRSKTPPEYVARITAARVAKDAALKRQSEPVPIGTETYGGGRILDVERTATGFMDLDFNRAYNPTCYFSPTYSCPVPPKENRLPIAVRAGEKVRINK